MSLIQDCCKKLDTFWKDHHLLDTVLHPGYLFNCSDSENDALSTQQFRQNVESTEPIQIPKRKPRRRLYSGGSISEEEELYGGDSGFHSPGHVVKQSGDGYMNLEDTIHEEQEHGNNIPRVTVGSFHDSSSRLNESFGGRLNRGSSVFLFDDEVSIPYHRQNGVNGYDVSPHHSATRSPDISHAHSPRSDSVRSSPHRPHPNNLCLDFLPHHRVASIRTQHASRQVSALCSPAGYPVFPQRYPRQRSFSQTSDHSYGPAPFTQRNRECTASNISLLSFGRNGFSQQDVSFLSSTPTRHGGAGGEVYRSQNESMMSSTPNHEYRQRSVSDASAPPLPEAYYDQMIQGYENMTLQRAGCPIPPPSPLDYSLNYYIHFPDEPPPPYEEEDPTLNTEENEEGNEEEEEVEEEYIDDCVKEPIDVFNENADVSSRLDEDWLLPNDNHAYNPQWLQDMEVRPVQEYEPFRNLSEDDAIEALSQFVSSNCCYNTGVAKQMKTKEIRPSNGHQYVLETYFEERSVALHQEPYTCQVIDTRDNGDPPAAWDIIVPRPRMFQQNEVHVEVPHTASIKEKGTSQDVDVKNQDCSSCCGKGLKECKTCSGSGDLKCSVCDGLGIIHNYAQEDLSVLDRRTSSVGCTRSCHCCNAGKKLCDHCSGKGQSDCRTCQSSGRVKVFLRLSVKWKIKRAQKILGKTKLPNKCITQVSGTLVFQEQNDRVYPLLDFPEDAINMHSRKLINRHEDELKHGRIIMQRHCVREVPIAEIRSQWKRQEFTYWVYGNENQVYCPDYPSKCFVGCTIL